jgi:CMP-N-acetylneuraminic acid synthetase
MFTLDDERRLLAAVQGPEVTRRQEAPATYRLNGAVYVAEVTWLLSSKSFMHDDTRGYVMPGERSIDVDTEIDVLVCEALLSRRAR